VIQTRQLMTKARQVADQKLATLYQKLEKAVPQLPLVTSPQELVLGEGSSVAEIMCIGEAPGFHEVQQRRPFVGRSGQLLRQTLSQILHQTELSPADIFISNIVKARPPENRDPTPAEILAYKPFLDEEIEIISPKLIVTLGRYSMKKFLPTVLISQVHGRLHKVKWNGRQQFVLPMYHPAAGLRSSKVKASFIEDFQKLPKILIWVKEQQELQTLSQDVSELLQ
jgi:uracil-DNA glycosylase